MLYATHFSPPTAISALDKAPARWQHAAMQPLRFFLPLFLGCAALSPVLAELTEATADDLYVLRHWEEHQGTATSMKPGEMKLLVSPDGHHKAEYFHDGCGVTIELHHHPLHEAASHHNARHIRLLLAGGKVNPRLPDSDGKYAWELTEDEECRQLLLTAAGTPDSSATLRHLRAQEDGFNEWEPEPLKKFLEPTSK